MNDSEKLLKMVAEHDEKLYQEYLEKSKVDQRRQKILPIDFEELENLLKGDSYITNFPVDSEVICVCPDNMNKRQLNLLLRHSSFEEVPRGENIPYLRAEVLAGPLESRTNYYKMYKGLLTICESILKVHKDAEMGFMDAVKVRLLFKELERIVDRNNLNDPAHESKSS